MADEGSQEDVEARLEPPSLFRRRKKTPVPEPANAVPAGPQSVDPEPANAVPAGPQSVDPEPVDPEPVSDEPAAGEPELAREVESEPVPVVEPEPEPVASVPEPAPEPAPVAFETTPEPEVAAPQRTITSPVTPTPATPAPVTEHVPAQSVQTQPVAVSQVATQQVAAPVAVGELEPAPPRTPWLTGQLAVVVTGLVVGILVVLLTAAGERLCTVLKGTSSCGGPGLFLLVAILVVAVVLGAFMMRAAQLPESTSTSVLAVGLLSVLILLLLVGSIFSWWMIIAIPVASMASFSLSHWVTTAVVETDDY